jgi:hypothetical protein
MHVTLEHAVNIQLMGAKMAPWSGDGGFFSRTYAHVFFVCFPVAFVTPIRFDDRVMRTHKYRTNTPCWTTDKEGSRLVIECT